MKREKFLQDAKLDPPRYYRNPGDIARDRRLTDEDRIAIVEAWERSTPADEAGEIVRHELHRVRQQIENGSQPSLARTPQRA